MKSSMNPAVTLHYAAYLADLPTLPTGALLRLATLALWQLLLRAPTVVGQWHQRARQRADLRDLDAHLLRDIGITHVQARQEGDKWFWQA